MNRKIVSFVLKFTNYFYLVFICFVSRRFRNFKRPDYGDTLGKRLLVVRHGGVGDLIFLLPSLSKLKKAYPEMQIAVMTRKKNFDLFQSIIHVDRIIDHTWTNFLHIFLYDYVLFLDDSIESDPDAERVNIYDLFAEKYFGITLEQSEKNPCLIARYWECIELNEKIPHPCGSIEYKVGIQLRAGSPVRTPSNDFWIRFIASLLLERKDIVVYLIVERQFTEYAQMIIEGLNDTSDQKRIVNMGQYAGDLKRLIDTVSLMDLVVSPDSSVAHLAAGLQIPLIGIYGPFPGELRVKYYKNAVYFDAPVACAPCFTHGHKPCRMAKKKAITYSPCFEKINIANIVEKVAVLVKYKKQISWYD
jgi:ADP-heptose:LPS heptosyltransferase